MSVHEYFMGMDGFRRSCYCSCQRIIGPGRHGSKNGLIVKWRNHRRYSKEGVRVLAPRGASGSRSRVGEGVNPAVPPPFHPQSVQSWNLQEDSRELPLGLSRYTPSSNPNLSWQPIGIMFGLFTVVVLSTKQYRERSQLSEVCLYLSLDSTSLGYQSYYQLPLERGRWSL